jgi:hypothetical protein
VAFAAFLHLLFAIGERGFGTSGRLLLGGIPVAGFAAQLFDALADRRKVVGRVGSGHHGSSDRAAAGAVRAG